jgi:ligand-binding sensor domain-containing protein
VREGKARRVWQKEKLSARSIHEDEAGTVWLGTMAGLVRISGESVAVIGAAQGLPIDDIYQVVSDRRGGLWLGSTRGIARVGRRELEEVAAGRRPSVEVEQLGAADGMRTSEATYWGAASTSDGRVWFTTTEGVVVIDPGRIPRNGLVPPVVVERVLADGKRLELAPEARVPAGSERLVIEYTALSLLVPQRVRFKFRLEGHDREWMEGGASRRVSYTRLAPGSYRFRVLASNNDGLWNEEGASVQIRQLPRLYQTAWFRAAAILSGALVVAGALGLRTRRHNLRERELQRRVAAALAQIKTLRGLLPTCAWCKKVRNDDSYWSQLDEYVRQHTDAEFSHGICPECRKEQFSRELEGRPGTAD